MLVRWLVVLSCEIENLFEPSHKMICEWEKCWSGVYKGSHHSRPSHLVMSLCFVTFEGIIRSFCSHKRHTEEEEEDLRHAENGEKAFLQRFQSISIVPMYV